jgi:hypothetical protein
MVGNQGPGKTLRLGFIDQSTQTANEFITIIIVKKNFTPFYSPGHDVVHSPWRVYPGSSWHTS